MAVDKFLIPFAHTGEVEDIPSDTSPTGDMSLEKGYTSLFELKPEEGGLFILRKKFNKLLNLISTYVISWRKQTFPDWIADAGSGVPYSYPKEAIVRYTDGNVYVSKVIDNVGVPSVSADWVLFSSYASININGLTNKTTPVDTDNFLIQEVAGTFKKLTWANLKATFMNSIGLLISGLTARSTPVDADVFVIGDSSSTFASKSLTFLNLKATLLTYFDTLYSRTTALFAIGQTLQDVTASRAVNGIYTNSTGKAITVFIISGSSQYFQVNGVNVAITSTSAASTMTVIVPNGATYKMLGAFSIWTELR